MQADEKELLTFWLAEQVMAVVADEKELAEKALKVVKKNHNLMSVEGADVKQK